MATDTDISNFAGRSVTIQDAAIADKKSELETDLQKKTDAAEEGMTSLLSTVSDREDAHAVQLKAQGEATEAFNDEVTSFEAVNATALDDATVADADGKLYFVGETFGTLSADGEGGLEITEADQVANLVDGEWVFEDGATELKGLSDLYAEVQVLAAADEALSTARTALQDAVKAVIVLENDVFSVADLGSAVTFDDDTGKATVNAAATDVTVFETEADAEADAVAAVTTTTTPAETEVFTADFAGETSSDGATINVVFDGTTITLGQGATSTAIATAVAGGTFTNWTAEASNSTVTFTAKTAGDVTDIKAGDIAINDDGAAPAAPAAPASVGNVAVSTQGVDAVDATTNPTDLDGAAAPDAVALAEAIETLSAFEELSATFDQARDLNTQLTSLEGDIEDATAAIENATDDEDAPGLGVTLSTFEDGAQGTSDNEVFLFEDSTDAAITIGDFGAGGEDQIFFSKDFSFVEVNADGITGNNGAAGELEIFWEQDGSDLNLYVEAETFGGNSAGTADLTKITLTGVDAADINDQLSSGFLTAGEVA
jgi:hypothetical protein